MNAAQKELRRRLTWKGTFAQYMVESCAETRKEYYL